MNPRPEHATQGEPTGMGRALSILTDLDRCRDTRSVVAMALFLLAAGCGVAAFFLVLDLLLWEGISEHGALLVTTLAWASVFPVWALVFMMLMHVADAVGIVDLRRQVRDRLADLDLRPGEIERLERILAGRRFRHRVLFLVVVRGLKEATRYSEDGWTPV